MLNELFRRKSVERILRESEKGRMESEHGGSLQRTLRARDLTAFGIAAIIGAGIFGTVGQAAASGGPAVSLLFLFIALACGFTAFCYAEFASIQNTRRRLSPRWSPDCSWRFRRCSSI